MTPKTKATVTTSTKAKTKTTRTLQKLAPKLRSMEVARMAGKAPEIKASPEIVLSKTLAKKAAEM